MGYQAVIRRSKIESPRNQSWSIANQWSKQWREIPLSHFLLLPYYGPKGEKLIRSIKKALRGKLPDNIVTKLAYSAMQIKR